MATLAYPEFLRTLIEAYTPFPYEIDRKNPLYGKSRHQNWAVRHSLRFHHVYATCDPFLRSGAAVLDLGAFPGSYLKILRLFYGERLRLVAAGMAVEASFPHDLLAYDIPFISCDLDTVLPHTYAGTLALREESFDLVVCTEMIEHLYSVTTLMHEVWRILRPGGVCYIGTNNVAYLVGILRLLRGETNLDVELDHTSALMNSEWRGHVRFYSLGQLVTLGQHFGLEVADKGYFQLRAPRAVVARSALPRWYASRLLDLVVSPLPIYQSHIFVLLRKPDVYNR